jgi:DNA-binding IclR family transcriptional regulator
MVNVEESYPGTQAVVRAVALLKAFGVGQPERNLADLARATGLNKTTAYRILAALERERLITRNRETGAYRPGPELIALGNLALRANDLRSVSRPVLEQLAETTGETSTLEVLSGTQVLVLDEVSSRHLIGMSQDVGARLPIHATSTGKLLLACAAPEFVDALLAAPLTALTPHTFVDPARLRGELAAIRAQGYAVAQQELEIGFVAVAAPILNHAHEAPAAISVGGPSLRLHGDTLARVVAQVQAAARQISRQIGYRPEAGIDHPLMEWNRST